MRLLLSANRAGRARSEDPMRLTLSTLATATLALAVFAAPAMAGGPLSEIVVDVQEDAQPVRDVLRRLESKHGLNYVVSEEVLARAGTVTVRLKKVPLEDALHAITSACGLTLEIRGTILILLPKASLRPALPAVREGTFPKGRDTARRKFVPDARRTPAARGKADRAPRASSQDLARAVGTVLEVDRTNRRLLLNASGLKRDFYLPDSLPGNHAHLARLESALGHLVKGHRVALEYRRGKHKSFIVNLVGGDQVRDNRLAVSRRKKGAKNDKGVKAPGRSRIEGRPNPKTAPEGVDMPESVLAGRFLSYKDGVAKVKRGDGEVVEVSLPKEAERAARVKAVLEVLEADSQVFFIYATEDGKLVVQDTGITEAKKK
jgi:hypothetical protein